MATPSSSNLISCLYKAYEDWLGRYHFACGPGCSTCCTSSVAMTTLEGGQIVEYLTRAGRLAEVTERLAVCRLRYFPSQTTNQFAASCLARTGTDTEQEPAWDLTPCPFLVDNLCTIYPIRPFGCRAFVSTRPCRDQGSAQLDPLLITINAIMMQVIEHLDSSGGLFGNLVMVLQFLLTGPESGARPHLLTARPNPGFLVLPEETGEVARFLGHINRSTFADSSLGQELAASGVYAGGKPRATI